MVTSENECPYPDRECASCDFYWIDGCTLGYVRKEKEEDDKDDKE